MSTPIDLSNALKTPPPPASAPGGRKPGGKPAPRPEDIARPFLWISLAAAALLLIYLGGGLLGGAWADPQWKRQAHEYHLLQLSNIGLVLSLMRVAAVVLVAAMLVCCPRDEGAGYGLLGGAALLYFGLPLLTAQVYVWQGQQGTSASHAALIGAQSVALLYGLPGLLWTAVSVVRRLVAASEVGAIRRANARYATAGAARALGVKAPGHVTALQRRNRTYQIVSVAIFVVEPLLVLLNLDTVKGWTGGLLAGVEQVTNRFTLAPDPHGLAPLHDEGADIILWTVLIALNLVLLSQVVRFVEFLCFGRRKPNRLD